MSKIIGVHIPAELKNLAINGAFDFWQRVETATTTINTATSSSGYTADMVVYSSAGATVKNYSVVKDTTNLPTFTQSGFQSGASYKFTMITGIASPANSDLTQPFQYRMEGLDYAKIHGKTITVGFWAYASVAGSYSFVMLNTTGLKQYATSFTISGSNTWQFISLTVPLDNASSGWNFDNLASLFIYIGAYGGSDYATSNPNVWKSGTPTILVPGLTNWQATSGAILNIAQFSIVEGNLGLGATGFSRTGKSIQQELALCQRYFEKTYDVGTAIGTNTTTNAIRLIAFNTTEFYASVQVFKVSKRVDPSVAGFARNGSAGSYFDESLGATNGNFGIQQQGMGGFYLNCSTTFTAGHIYTGHWTAEAGL